VVQLRTVQKKKTRGFKASNKLVVAGKKIETIYPIRGKDSHWTLSILRIKARVERSSGLHWGKETLIKERSKRKKRKGTLVISEKNKDC